MLKMLVQLFNEFVKGFDTKIIWPILEISILSVMVTSQKPELFKTMTLPNFTIDNKHGKL